MNGLLGPADFDHAISAHHDERPVADLRNMARFIEAARLSPAESVRTADKIAAELTAAGKAHHCLCGLPHIFSEWLLIPSNSYVESAVKGKALIDAADAALAVEQFRRRHGMLPDRLEQLVPEFLSALPSDPFDGQSLRFAVTPGGGYVVYSVGKDGVDQGGETATDGAPLDLAFLVEPKDG
jgi:hypothetical protein